MKINFHILIIDDEPAVRKLLTKILTADGYTVAGAAIRKRKNCCCAWIGGV